MIQPLSNFVDIQKTRYQNLDQVAGVYAFWFQNQDRKIKTFNRELNILGVNGNLSRLEWYWNLDQDQVLLYVGKTLNVKNRIGQHLKLGTIDWISKNNNTLFKKTTSCQLRSGMEHLAKNTGSNAIKLIEERIGFTFIPIQELEIRFFVENLAIGLGKPWLNVDSER